MTTNYPLTFSMSDEDARALSDCAQYLGISRVETVVKGLQLMALYVQSHQTDDSNCLILQTGGKETIIDIT